MIRGSESIIKTIENELGIKLNETTKDEMFTLSEVECLGACVNAPMMQVNNKFVYEDLNEENIKKILKDFKDKNEVKIGS